MAERSRGKRRKQANPRRNQGDIERCLGSEGEDEGSVWGMEVLDSRDGQDKISLTPSEGTEPGSPAPCVRSQSLSPPGESWGETETTPLKITAGDPEHSENSMYSQRDVGVLENASHYDSMVQLRKVSHLLSPLHGQQRNGSMASYHLGGVHDDMSLVSWSPGEHESPEGKDGVPLNSDAPRIQVQACPFCQRTYRRDASLREHMKFCQEREGGDNICPLCGYSTPYRAQMERHLTLHSQTQEKNPMSDPTMENRKFKCNQCGKAFKYKHHLKEHLRIHSGEKPYECSNCKKRFSHSGSYSSHLSSKKCLSGGGAGNGAHFNGHSHSAYLFPSPVSPPVVGGRNGSRGKSSPYPPLGQFPTDQLAHTGQDSAVPVLHALELSRSWDPAADLAMRTGVFKGTTLLPLLQSRSKFEHLLQEMLRREVGRDEERASRDGGEEKGGRERKVETQIGAISCRWCSQLFPSEAILAHHERYQCRTRDGVNIPPSPRHRDGSPLNFSRASHLPYDTQTSPTANNVPFRDISSPQRASWHSVPQQLLVPLPTPVQIPQDPTHKHWPNEGTVSPRKPNAIDPTSPTIPERQHLISSRFGSPPCLDLSINTTSPRQPVRHNSGSAGIQNEPLDLSIPKPHSARPREGRDQTCNGYSPHQERRDPEGVFKRLTPPSQQQVGRAYEAAPLFGSTVFSNYPLFNHIIPGSLAGMGHNGLTSLPLTPTPSPGFLSPVAYMLEAESESMLKRMQHDRHSIMGEAMSRGGIDYLSLMEEGMDGEMGPGRKRLKKTEEGLYACDICDKTFQKSSSLLRHKYEHTGKRPHECQICKKAFKHKHHLIEHSRLHSGEKPYQCDKCGKRFSHSGSYSQHMNHRYAFCSRDNDPDGPGEDPALGDVVPYLSPVMERDPGAEVPAPTLEDSATYLSDSSLEGAALEYREEEQEEEEDESSLSNHVHDRVMVERAMMKESRVTPEHLKEETEDGTLEEGAEVEGQDVEENHQENLVKAEQEEERERTNETNIERE